MALAETWLRMRRLTLEPAAAWREIARAPVPVRTLVVCYVLPLALLAPASTMLGMRVFDGDWSVVHGYLVPSERIVLAGLTTLVASVASVFVLAAIFWLIAPLYGARRNYPAALNVAVLGAVPVWLSGVLLVLPALAMVSLVAFCHTLYLYFLGAHEVLGVGSEGQADFVGVSLVLLAVVSTAIGATASALGII